MSTITRLLALPIALVFVTVGATGCKKEAEPETSGTAAPKTLTDRFTDNLADTEFINYAIAIGGGGSLTYSTLAFAVDGTWSADAVLKLAEDPFDCVESGTWSIADDGPMDEHTSRLNISVTATDCPGREPSKKRKVEIRIHGKGNRPAIVDL